MNSKETSPEGPEGSEGAKGSPKVGPKVPPEKDQNDPIGRESQIFLILAS